MAKSPVTCVHSCPFSARGSIVAGLYTVSDDRGAPLGRGCLSVLGDFRCQFTRFLKEFSPSPQPLTAPDFRLQPPRLLFLEDEYPKTSRPTDTSTLQDRQPTLRPSQGLLQCQLPQHQPSARSQGLARRTQPEAKSQFRATPIGSTKNWVRSFILPYPRARAIPARRPQPEVPESIGGPCRGSLENLKIQPLASFPQPAGVTRAENRFSPSSGFPKTVTHPAAPTYMPRGIMRFNTITSFPRSIPLGVSRRLQALAGDFHPCR